jgi:tetratricopeptide (TPR) repeat protein
MMNIAAARAQQGNLEEATPMLERALPELERIYGPAHMETIGARMNLAAFRQMSGDAEGAADAYATVLPRAETALGPDHPQVARVLHSQGVTLNELGRHDEAIAALRRAVDIRTAIFGSDHDDTVASLLSLATGYGGAGDTERLRSAFDEVVARRARKLGDGHVEVARDLDVYAEALAANGLDVEAAAIRTRAARIREAQPEE